MIKTEYSQSRFKVKAREENIRIFRRVTGLSSIPQDKTYWTLCNIQPQEKGSEIVQLVGSGLIQKPQFVGVDNSREFIEQNKLWHPEAQWMCGDWLDVISSHPNFNPAMVYLDTTSFADHSNAVRLTVGTMIRCKAGTVLLANVMLNDPRSCRKFSADKLIELIVRQVPAGELSKWESKIENYEYRMTRYTTMGTFVFFKKG